MSTKKYFCLNAVLHNRKRYAAGEAIELTDEEAKPLLSSHAVTKHDPKKGDDADAKAKAEAEANQAKK